MSRSPGIALARLVPSTPARWTAVALVVLSWGLLAAPGVKAAEFATPPGINVRGQEQLLKEKISGLARDLVGDRLVDVIVHVAYLRTARRQASAQDRVKLPGLNNYIATQGPGRGEIVPEFSRTRQILVLVGDSVPTDPSALEVELRARSGLDPADGDWLRVTKVPLSANTGENAGEGGAQAKGGEGAADAAAREAMPKPKVELPPLSEAESTTFLVKARAAFFNGDYDRALDQILQSLSRNPNNPQAYAMLGSLYYTMNWRHLALKYWEKSLELDPENRELSDLITKMRQGGQS
jgi:hypothetical protein